MKKTTLRLLRQSAAVTAALTVTWGASFTAAANSGPYIGIEGGFNDQADQHVDRNGQNAFTYQFKNGYIGGLVFGYASPMGLRPELELDFRKNKFNALRAPNVSSNDVGGDENAYTGMANLWFDLKRPSGFFSVVHPYFGGGAGVARVESHDPTIVVTGPLGNTATAKGNTAFDAVFAYQGGGGIGFDVSPTLTLSLDYRHLETRAGSFETNNAGAVQAHYRSDSAMLGLRHSFGVPPPLMVVEAAPPIVIVPVDSDGDGVLDESDQCPNTPRGFRVDMVGCIVEQKVTLRGINFVFDSDQLTVPAQTTLDEVGTALVGQPTLSVQIVGHTDNVGSEAYNNTLSQKRTESVRTYLVAKGVSADNLQAHGAGEAEPIASNDTEDGRAENRRVEFIVVNKPSGVKVQSEGSTQQSRQAAEAGEPATLSK